MPTSLLNPSQRQSFRENGYLVLPGFYDRARDIEPVQRAIHHVIGQVMLRHGVEDQRPPYEAAHFDAGYLDLIRLNRAWGGEVYDAVKQIPAFVRLVAHPAHEQIVQELRPGSQPAIAAGGYGIRIDNPQEERFLAQWHQEYPSQLRSGRRTTIERIGRINALPHGCGLLPVGTGTAGFAVQFGGDGFKALGILAVQVDLEQLQVDGITLLILLQGLEKNLLGLGVTTISHVHVGLGHRIDFIGINAARTRLAEIGMDRGLRGIDTLPAGAARRRGRSV